MPCCGFDIPVDCLSAARRVVMRLVSPRHARIGSTEQKLVTRSEKTVDLG